VIASDGLWEFISEQQVMETVSSSFIRNDAQSAVKDLENLALEAWKRED
jgi:serine/threonine protein phosphatase PrpC